MRSCQTSFYSRLCPETFSGLQGAVRSERHKYVMIVLGKDSLTGWAGVAPSHPSQWCQRWGTMALYSCARQMPQCNRRPAEPTRLGVHLCETPGTVSGSHGHLYIFCMLVGGPAKNPNLNKLRERRGVFTQPTALPRSFSTSLPPPSSFLLAALPQNPPLFPPSHYSLLFCATQIFLGYCVCKQNVQRNTTVQ